MLIFDYWLIPDNQVKNIGIENGDKYKEQFFVGKEWAEDLENKKYIETKIILEIMRHGEKEISAPTPEKPDEEIRLSKKGRGDAVAKGIDKQPNADVSVAWGSEKKRTQEAAALVMLAKELTNGKINPDASLEEINETIKKEFGFGGKIGIDKRLSFSAGGPSGPDMQKSFREKRLLEYLIKDSDKRTIETGDKMTSTYSRFAGNIAGMIERYMRYGNSLNKIASKSDEYIKKYGNTRERYLGTHQGAIESFLMKVLEKTQGAEKRDEFIAASKGGFKELQGMNIEINNKGNDQEISLSYEIPNLENEGKTKKETIKLGKDLIDEIIKEKEIFEEEVEKNTTK